MMMMKMKIHLPLSPNSSFQAFTVTASATTINTKSSANTLYQVLRVKESASHTEIKAAYRHLAKLYHPDAAQGQGPHFIEIHQAYATLSDPAARARYDLSIGAVTAGRFRYPAVRPTKRWETDQCW